MFLVISLLPAVPQYLGQIYLALTQPPGASQIDPVALGITSVGSLVSIVLFFVSARLFLMLPAKALERDDITLGTVWAATKRNSWRMVWGYVFCLLPMVVVGGGIGIAFWLSSALESRAVAATVWTALTLTWIIFGMVSVGFLSLAYRHFFEQDTSPSP
jgi:membrane-anchored glycerophosphoryl diester phosphodiesterase (GDPDase)